MLYEKANYILERTEDNNTKKYYQGNWHWNKYINKAYIFDSLDGALNALDFHKWLSKEKGQVMYYTIIKCE